MAQYILGPIANQWTSKQCLILEENKRNIVYHIVQVLNI